MTTKQAMRPSEELLALRERVAGMKPWGYQTQVAAGYHVGTAATSAWIYLDAQANLPGMWCRSFSRTHLEVVELIERAAVAAMREEGR